MAARVRAQATGGARAGLRAAWGAVAAGGAVAWAGSLALGLRLGAMLGDGLAFEAMAVLVGGEAVLLAALP
jgi:hypothetical protein